MPARVPVGAQHWSGFHVVCKPLELGGIDRRLFGLLMIVFMVFWQGMGSFFLGVGATVVLYVFFRRLTKSDPQFFSVLRLAARHPAAWYDPATVPTEYGPYLVTDVGEFRRRRRAARERARGGRRTWRTRILDGFFLVTGGSRDVAAG